MHLLLFIIYMTHNQDPLYIAATFKVHLHSIFAQSDPITLDPIHI